MGELRKGRIRFLRMCNTAFKFAALLNYIRIKSEIAARTSIYIER
jgi:hypothetical protein